MNIFGVSPMVQDKEVTHYCFGVCGHIQCAGADGGDDIGSFFLCREQECPYTEKTSPVIGDIQGEPFQIRKLMEVKP